MFSVAADADADADHSDGESLSLSNYMHSLMWPASERLMNSSACGFARSLTHSLTHSLSLVNRVTGFIVTHTVTALCLPLSEKKN